MTMHAAPVRTQAETALLRTFDERLSQLPGDEAVMLRRDDAIEAIKAGLPTRRVEAWHYTDLRRLLTAVPDAAPAGNARALRPLVEGSTVLSVLGGVAQGHAKADGVAVEPVSAQLADGRLAPRLVPLDRHDMVGAINAALVADGFTVDIAAGAVLTAPIELQNVHAGGQAHVRFPVTIGAGARAMIVERQTGEGTALTTSIADVEIGAGAHVTWVIVQDQPDSAAHLARFGATLGPDAHLTLFLMNVGGRLIRQEIMVAARGEGSSFTLRGANLLGGDTHCDVTMVLDHAVPHTGSTEVVRNVVTDRARGVFQGRINVHQPAQKTDARMACNTLLLSDDAEFLAKPELEIFADDVACGHGATVTEIDRNHLFYLMARGIDEKTARGLLVKAFLAEVIEELEDEPLVDALEARLDAWFAVHG